MIPDCICRLVLFVIGLLVPAYWSYKTVKAKNRSQYVIYLMYWTVIALSIVAEIFTDIFLAFWLPFYNEFKILYVLWLVNKSTNGSAFIYRRIVNPLLKYHEEKVDNFIIKVQNHPYVSGLVVILHIFFALKDAFYPYFEQYLQRYLKKKKSSLKSSEILQQDADIMEDNFSTYRNGNCEESAEEYLPQENFEMVDEYESDSESSAIHGKYSKIPLNIRSASQLTQVRSPIKLSPIILLNQSVDIKKSVSSLYHMNDDHLRENL